MQALPASLEPLVESAPAVARPGEAELELTILMPCLDEARTVGACVAEAHAFLQRHGIAGEVLVADNGSKDGSRESAERSGARVVLVWKRGYGAALAGGIAAARGRYVIMGDSDGSYGWSELMPFVERLRAGCALVVGNRFRGGIEPGAMPLLHRYLGNPVLTAIGRRLFGSGCGDFYCGQRGFERAAALRMELGSSGMEYALEMLVRATRLGLHVSEVPIRLARDGRGRRSHLRTWRDGWRSLCFLFLNSPRWLFLYPGFFLLALGLGLAAWALPGTGPLAAGAPALLLGAAALCGGFQLVLFSLFATLTSTASGFGPPQRLAGRALDALRLERGLVSGGLLVLAGLGASAWALRDSAGRSAGDWIEVLRALLPPLVLLLLGLQVIASSLYLGLLELALLRRHPGKPR